MRTTFACFFTVLFFATTSCTQEKEPFDIAVKGGVSYVLEPDVPAFLLGETGRADTLAPLALQKAIAGHQLQGEEIIEAFVSAYEVLAGPGKLSALLARNNPKAYASGMDKETVQKKLLLRFGEALKATAYIVEKRLYQTGLEADQFAVSRDGNMILVHVAIDADRKRVEEVFVQGGGIGFYETYDPELARIHLLRLEEAVNKETGGEPDGRTLADILVGAEGSDGASVGWIAIGDTARVARLLSNGTGRRLLPPDMHFRFGFSVREADNGRQGIPLYALKVEDPAQPPIGSSDIQYARAAKQDYNGTMGIDVTMTHAAAKKWERLTEKSINRYIAIVFNGRVVSAPRVVSSIANGNATITGNFTLEEAQATARLLITPPYPCRMLLHSVRTVSPN